MRRISYAETVVHRGGFVPVLGAVAAAVIAGLYLRERRERHVRRASERLSAATLETLLNAIDANDAETGAHVRRVAEFALILAGAADVGESECKSVERVALFHDIGKIHEALFDILRDDAELTPEERRAIRTHPERGAVVLHPLDAFYPDLHAGVLAHHERWDGKGYPRGLRGPKIPLAARIVSIADSFDAMISRREYQHSQSMTEAAQLIAAGRGTQFDPELVDLFLSPPVLTEIEHVARQSQGHARRAPGGQRRHSEKASATPDITFRWRSTALARPPRDRGH